MKNAPIIPANPRGITQAVRKVREGGVVIYPTETVYGLGVDPFKTFALNRIFKIKGRNAEKALILLIRGEDDLSNLVTDIPKSAQILMDAFWPGPLTLVFPAHPDLPEKLLGGGKSIALRLSNHPTVCSMLDQLGGPITSTSSNRSGFSPARSASEAASELGFYVDLILDNGPTIDNNPSTVVDVSSKKPDLLREGQISVTTLQQVIAI